MKDIIQDKIEFAKDLLAVKEAKAAEREVSDAVSDDNSILWIKARWKQLYEINVIISYSIYDYR